MTHNRAVIATGVSHGRTLTLTARHPLTRGGYTLTLITPGHRTVVSITIR